MRRLPPLVVLGVIAGAMLWLSTSAGAGPRHCGNVDHTDTWTIVETADGGIEATGTDGDDVFIGWRYADATSLTVLGLGGDDVICGADADDTLDGGAGDDVIDGHGGSDDILGGPGDDLVMGGDGPDRVEGQDGDDSVWGNDGVDVLVPGAGDDYVWDDGVDMIVDAGADTPDPLVSAPPPPTPPADEPPAFDIPTPTAQPTPQPTPTAQPTATAQPTTEPTPAATTEPTPTPQPTVGAPTPTVPPVVPVDGQFTIVGRQIFDPAGEPFYPIGANAGPPLRDTNGDCVWWLSLRCSDMTGRLGSVQAWNWNILRVNVLCRHVNLGNGQRHGPDEMFAAVDLMVEEYTAAGVVLMLDCHDTTGVNPAVGSAMWNDLTAFWDRAIERYGDNPYVWINFANEFETQYGGDQVYFREFTQAAYDHLRGAGYRGVMVMDLPNWAQHIQFFEDPANLAWSRQFDQVLWGWHAYGGVAADGQITSVRFDTPYDQMAAIYDDIIDTIVTNEIPVIVGEFGYDWDDQRRIADGWSWISMRNSALLNVERLYDAGIGMTVWHANGSAGTFMPYGLKADDQLTFDEPTVDANLSELGQRYWDLTRRIGTAATD